MKKVGEREESGLVDGEREEGRDRGAGMDEKRKRKREPRSRPTYR